MLVSGKTFSRLFDLASTWRSYRDAMARRRPGSELSHNAFGYYTRHRCSVYLSPKGSALIGQVRKYDGHEVFCVSHHAPASHRDGVELLKKLARDRNVLAVLTVTEDLVSMLLRCGFRDTGYTHVSDFRGEPVQKFVLANFSTHGLYFEA